jgi:hypothetical protein
MLFSALLSFLLVWSITEISQKIFFDELIFFIALAGGVQLRLLKKSFDDPR